MKFKNKLFAQCLATLILLALVSCNLLASQPGTATIPVATSLPAGATATTTEEPVVLAEPDAGTSMLWSDNSYVVYVPAGNFIMGKDEVDLSDHSPAHTVTLGGYWIQQAEVTNAMYALCVSLGICTPPAHEIGTPDWYASPEYSNAPVVGVNWNQAETYCEWIEARLPTEAEWEKASRGTDGASYPWGEDEPTCSLLNFEDCLAIPAPEVVRTYPLGASPYNLADTAGNISEWVFDWYADEYYSASPSNNPLGPDIGEKRVVRGSSYLTPADELNISLRNALEPEQERADLGFRCVLSGELLTDDTPTTPACTTLSFDLVIPAHQWPVQVPVNPPGVSLQTYCIEDNQNNQYGTASIWLEQGVDPAQVTISSPNGTLNCNQDGIDPQKFNCGGSALKPGLPVTISVCNLPVPPPPPTNPTCPVFYTFIPATGMCEYGNIIPVVCIAPDVVIPGYGCLPAPQNGKCPVGSYSADYNGQPVCVPASGAMCQGQFCMANCPEGLVFNEGNFCCDYPTDVQPICPPSYTYNSATQNCVAEAPIQADCTTITTPVQACAPHVTVDCSTFKTDGDCNANPSCSWHAYAATAGGYCTNK